MGFTPTREELAWCAGFFDGEGWVGHHAHKNPDHRGRVPAVAITQVGRFVLDRFRDAVGVGRVYGPYAVAKKNHHPKHRYSVSGHPHVQAIAAMLWAWLSPVKREQFRVALTEGRPSRAHRRYAPPCEHGILKPLKKCGVCRRAYFRAYFTRPYAKVAHLARSRQYRLQPGVRERENARGRDYMRRKRARLKET